MTRYFQLAEQKLCLLTPGYQSWKAPPPLSKKAYPRITLFLASRSLIIRLERELIMANLLKAPTILDRRGHRWITKVSK